MDAYIKNIDIKLLDKQIVDLLNIQFNSLAKLTRSQIDSIDGIIELLERISDEAR